jgi:hypothetical protein
MFAKIGRFISVMGCFLYLGTSLCGGDDRIYTLPSADQFNKEFRVVEAAERSTSHTFFIFRGVHNTPQGQEEGRNLFIYDAKRLQVRSLFPIQDPTSGNQIRPSAIHDFTVDKVGKRSAISIQLATTEDRVDFRIVLVELEDGRCRFLADDGQWNYSPSISPDGKYVAYYSSDPRVGQGLRKPLGHSAGKVVCVETGGVTLFKKHRIDNSAFWDRLPAPLWIDDERVFFQSLFSENPVIDPDTKQEPVSAPCNGIIVANAKTHAVKSMYFPGKAGFRCVPDAPRLRLLFYSDDRLVEAGWDCEHMNSIYESDKDCYLVSLELGAGGEIRMKEKGRPNTTSQSVAYTVRIANGQVHKESVK